jgi:ribosomal protein S25
MSPEHRAIISLAEKEGLSPCEKDARLVVHDMVNATRKAMQKYEVGYNKMTEKQQDAVLGDLEAAFKDLALTVARTIASGGTPAISMTLKDMKISNGTVTGIVDGSDANFNNLIAKVQDKSEVMVVLYERQYADAMDAIQSDKDQKSLPLEGDKPAKPKAERKGSATSAAALAKKAIEIPPKLLADAKDFVTIQQNCKPSALQNHLKIGLDKAMAVLAKLEEEGVVTFVGDEKTGEYQLVRAPKTEASDLTPELYEKIKAKVIADQRVSIGGLAVAFDVETDLIEQAIEELCAEGIVSNSDEETGDRTVLQLTE